MTNQPTAAEHRAEPTTGTQPEQEQVPLNAYPRENAALARDDRVIPGEVIARSDDAPPADGTTGSAPRPVPRVEVGRDGRIEVSDGTPDGRDAVSEVTTDTFYTSVDLNAVAASVKAAQANGGEAPDPNKRVFVGPEGELRLGNEVTGGERISEVTNDTFYVASARHQAEAAFVRSHMPRNTIAVSDGTYAGWHFAITNEFGDTYKLFLYYHPAYGVYRVSLIEPRMEGTADAHGAHLWPDGTICLTRAPGSGYPDMGTTYAKAALWTRGASCYRRGYGFQFNIGQD